MNTHSVKKLDETYNRLDPHAAPRSHPLDFDSLDHLATDLDGRRLQRQKNTNSGTNGGPLAKSHPHRAGGDAVVFARAPRTAADQPLSSGKPDPPMDRGRPHRTRHRVHVLGARPHWQELERTRRHQRSARARSLRAVRRRSPPHLHRTAVRLTGHRADNRRMAGTARAGTRSFSLCSKGEKRRRIYVAGVWRGLRTLSQPHWNVAAETTLTGLCNPEPLVRGHGPEVLGHT